MMKRHSKSLSIEFRRIFLKRGGQLAPLATIYSGGHLAPLATVYSGGTNS